MRMPLKNSLILLAAATIWGTAFVAQSAGMDYMGPLTFNGLRYFLGAGVLIPVLLLRRFFQAGSDPDRTAGPGASEGSSPVNAEASNRTASPGSAEGLAAVSAEASGKPSLTRILTGGVMCGLFLCVASNLQQFAIISVEVGKAGFLTAMYIVIVPVLSFFITGKTSLRLWISVALACAGLYFLSISGGMRLEQGDLALILCAFVFSLHIMCIDRFTDVEGVLLSFMQFLVAGVLSIIFAAVFEEINFAAAMRGWFPIVYAGVFSCGIAYTFQIIGQKGADPAVASLILSLESVVSVLAGFLILGQKLTQRELFGCVLMFVAIVLVQIPVRKKIAEDASGALQEKA